MRLRLAPAVLLSMLVLGGCGGGEEGENEGSNQPSIKEDGERWELRYPTLEESIRDCQINGGDADYCEVRERCQASGETDTYCRDRANEVLEAKE